MIYKDLYMRISFFILLITLNLGQLHSQEAPPRYYEELADSLLQLASQTIGAYPSWFIRFDYIMENTQSDTREQLSGKLYTKGDSYHMKLGDNLFISDGHTVWSYISDIHEVHINLAEYVEDALTPTSILENFSEAFRSRWIRTEPHKRKTVHLIDLVPDSPQAFFKYRVALDQSSHQIVYTRAYDRHGGTYHYEITHMSTNPDIPQGLFKFDVALFPGIEVVDLR